MTEHRKQWQREYMAKRRREFRKNGCCQQCGRSDDRTKNGMCLCETCATKWNDYLMVYRKRKHPETADITAPIVERS